MRAGDIGICDSYCKHASYFIEFYGYKFYSYNIWIQNHVENSTYTRNLFENQTFGRIICFSLLFFL